MPQPAFLPVLGRAAAGAATHAVPLAKGAARLAGDLGRVVVGTDGLTPAARDRRFADPAWSENPLYRRLAQGYVAVGQSVARGVDALEDGGLDWRDLERVRYAAALATSALSPTNNPLTNPVALKTAFDTGGASVVRGVSNLVGDLRHNGGMPSQTDRSAFTVGEELAVTPGVVVHRDEVAEVIAYSPSTPQVHGRPLVVVPPPIGRYYFLDLRPGRSFVEHAVAQGLQVFMISWRNPGPDQADWDLDTYCARILSVIELVKGLTGSPDVNTLGFCAGGILQTLVLNHLAAQGDESIASASYGVTLLDFDVPAPLGAFSFAPLLAMARGSSRRKGILTAAALGLVFSTMRPDDLVFNYLVDGWLLGKQPPAFDILAWSVDGTNLPAGLHRQFLEVFQDNALCQPHGTKVLGTPVDLAQITVPTFVTGALTDHLTPWQGCYRTTQLLGGDSTFVLSNSGHIASLVNPPGNPKASYQVGGTPGPDAEAWRAGATKETGSWWTPWAAWAVDRSGPLQDAVDPAERFPVLEAAPGSYVVDRVPTQPAVSSRA
ncbi:MAG: Poly-beta-hydroxybutyrate polymerase domain protein [Frankiales bacterium]|nr:Poly-beta-hydroxybutyrate polymerase domain protein [Frankiales bacterium]